MKEVGYECKIKSSTRSRSGAQKVVVENCAGNRNIAQLQVSPGYKRFYLTFSDLQILQTVSEEFKDKNFQPV